MNLTAWGVVVLDAAALLYCLVISLFIVPVVLERMTFYIPRLVMLVRDKSVYRRSVIITVFEMVAWVAVVAGAYVFLYYSFPTLIPLVTLSPMAVFAWGAGIANIIYRHARFNKFVKRDFYHNTYMHYITPDALHAYQVFIEDLDDMGAGELENLSRLGRAIPYMHRQALHRKMGEKGMLDNMVQRTQKVGMFSLMTLPGPQAEEPDERTVWTRQSK